TYTQTYTLSRRNSLRFLVRDKKINDNYLILTPGGRFPEIELHNNVVPVLKERRPISNTTTSLETNNTMKRSIGHY
uniref:Uncharacterized protein n=1 Tax=Strigamia maritima TaxID=126957 RepID=T1JMY9_STRMM